MRILFDSIVYWIGLIPPIVKLPISFLLKTPLGILINEIDIKIRLYIKIYSE